jgi:hypothetical protein
MLDYLIDQRLVVYLVLGALVLVFLGLLWRYRRKGWIAGVGVTLALLVAFFVFDRSVQKRREVIRRAVQEMVAGINERDADKVLRHVSAKFNCDPTGREAEQVGVRERRIGFANAFEKASFEASFAWLRKGNKDGFAQFLREVLQRTRVKNLSVEDIRFIGIEGKVVVEGAVEPKNGDPQHVRVIATFTQDDDSEWRMSTVEIFRGTSQDSLSLVDIRSQVVPFSW